MLAIKLQRIGKKGQPSYRLVVAEKKSKLKSPPVEDLGAYSSKTKEANFNKDRVSYWIKCGAQPTLTAHNLLVKHGVITGSKKSLGLKAKPKAAPAEAPQSAPAPEAAA